MYGFPGLRAGITRTCAGYSYSRSYIGGIFQHEIMGLLEYPLYVRGSSFIARRMLEYPLHVRVPAPAHLAPAVGRGMSPCCRRPSGHGRQHAWKQPLVSGVLPRWGQPSGPGAFVANRRAAGATALAPAVRQQGRHSVAGSRRTANHRAPPRLPAGGRSRVLQIVYLPNEDTGQLPSIPELAPESTRNRGRRNLSEAVKTSRHRGA